MSALPKALIITLSRDHFTIDRVAEGLQRRGVQPIRLDTDLYPTEIGLVYTQGTSGPQVILNIGETQLAANEIAAVWARRVWKPILPDDLDPQLRGVCERESRAHLQALFDALHQVPWINDPIAEHTAESKAYQLTVAARVGLRTPDTLMTNEPQEVRSFFDRHRGQVVTKLLTPVSISMEGDTPFVYTSRLKAADLDDLEQLRLCPMVFQELIPKVFEYRVSIVGEQIFPGLIDSSLLPDDQVDWRQGDITMMPWQRGELDEATACRLRQLMSELGLVYGAIDLIRTPAGEDVFLEINPGGEWGMLERDLGFAIGDAIAGSLVAAMEAQR